MERNKQYYIRLCIALAVVVILASSTSAAARLCDDLFNTTFSASGMHPNALKSLHFVFEKGLHVTLFAVFGHFLMLAGEGPWQRRACLSLATGVALGAAAEYLQTFFIGRDPAVRDVLLDICGTCLGTVVAVSLSFRPEAGRRA